MVKLPPTSYVRMVDIWLITTQLIPFLLVVMMTSIELFQAEENDINHHGFIRLNIYLKQTNKALKLLKIWMIYS